MLSVLTLGLGDNNHVRLLLHKTTETLCEKHSVQMKLRPKLQKSTGKQWVTQTLFASIPFTKPSQRSHDFLWALAATEASCHNLKNKVPVSPCWTVSGHFQSWTVSRESSQEPRGPRPGHIIRFFTARFYSSAQSAARWVGLGQSEV